MLGMVAISVRAESPFLCPMQRPGAILEGTPAQGRALIGPARPSCDTRSKLYAPEAFDVSMAEHRAVCPAGHVSTQCNRLRNRETGLVQYGFESGAPCDG